MTPSSETNSDTTSFLTLPLLSPDDPEGHVGHVGGFDDLRAFEFDSTLSEVVEEPDAIPEQDWHEVYVYLVKNSCPYALLRDTSGAHSDVLVARRLFRLLDGALDAFGDERVRRPLIDPVLWHRMGDDEARYAQRRFSTPPVGDVERPASGHKRTHPAVRFLK